MNWGSKENKQFIRALFAVRTPREMRAFLRDLMTEGEIIDFGKRLETARLLSEKVPYPEIQSATGFSSTTVARVSKWLQNGKGGYRILLGRIHHHTPRARVRGLD